MPVEDTARPTPAERPAAPARRSVERPAERRATRQSPAPADDDLGLGKLQGGIKPGDRKPAEPKKH
jgi:hypothetical protein